MVRVGQDVIADAKKQQIEPWCHDRPQPWIAALDTLLFGSHAERVIGICRVIFAGFALVAIYLDPTHPSQYVSETALVLVVYLIYAIVIACFRTRDAGRFYLQLTTHAIDIAALFLMVQLTDGLTSPFFAFLTFALLTGTLRWGWRGAFATAIVLELLLIVVVVVDGALGAGGFDENLPIMRGGNLLVTAAVLGYFGATRDHSRRRLAKLAAWPIGTKTGEEAAILASSLGHAADVLGSERLLVVWRDRDGAGGKVALWMDGACEFARLPESVDPACVADATCRAGIVGATDPAHPSQWQLSALPALAPRADASTGEGVYWTTTFRSPHYSGAVYILEPSSRNEDLAALVEIVGMRIATELERSALAKQAGAAERARERVRLARDMHDSVLQGLTAASLQLKAVALQSPPTIAERLGQVGRLLVEQQRRIRTFVENLRPSTPAPIQLAEQLEAFAQALQDQWQCRIDVRLDPPDLSVEARIAAEICQLVAEATANAVRHGGAKTVALDISRNGDTVRIALLDDGCGGLDAPFSEDRQPSSLAGRVEDLGGAFSWSDTGKGVHVVLDVPVAWGF